MRHPFFYIFKSTLSNIFPYGHDPWEADPHVSSSDVLPAYPERESPPDGMFSGIPAVLSGILP